MVSISTRATLAPFSALQMVQAASVASVRTRHQVGLEFESGHQIAVDFIFKIGPFVIFWSLRLYIQKPCNILILIRDRNIAGLLGYGIKIERSQRA